MREANEMNAISLFLRCLLLALSVFLGCGCSEDPRSKKTLVEFEAEDRVRIEGRSFQLKTDWDVCEARKAFCCSWNFTLANIEKTNYRKLWMFAYCSIPPEFPYDGEFRRSFVAANFYVQDTDNGRLYPVRFGGSWVDIGLNEQRKPFIVDPAGRRPGCRDLSEMNVQSVKNTYLELWCDRDVWERGHPVTGQEILEVLRRYYRFAGRDADTYLVPYDFESYESYNRQR